MLRLLLRTTSATRPPRSYGIMSVHLGQTSLPQLSTCFPDRRSQDSTQLTDHRAPGLLIPGAGLDPEAST